MKSNILYLFFICLLCSCTKNFLDRDPENNPSLDNYYNTAEEVQGATAYLYNQPWYGFTDKALSCIGDVLSGNLLTLPNDPNYGYNAYVNFSVPATDAQNLSAWQALYKVAGNATTLMNTLQQKRTQLPDKSFIDEGIAECRFMRGAAYFYIARIYGDAPIIADPLLLAGSGDYNVPRYFQKDVLHFALDDLKAAANALPDAPYQPGRATRFSAEGMMAKLYLYRGVYDSAKAFSADIINSGRYFLVADYEGMFTSAANNNNVESLFALQWLASGEYSYSNAQQNYFAPPTLLKPDFNTGYSPLIPSLNILSFYKPGDKRKKWSVMQQGFTKPNWKNKYFPNGFFYDTMTPPGHELDDTVSFKNGTRSNVLKYVIGPADNGVETLNAQGGSSICTYILRYADVLLIYAESILGSNASTTDAGALNAFNLVHLRAGFPQVSEITKEMIFDERRAELAFEGDYWFDVQRQGFARAQQIINTQNRGMIDNNGNINYVYPSFTEPSQLYLPIPANEVMQDPELNKAPVSYY